MGERSTNSTATGNIVHLDAYWLRIYAGDFLAGAMSFRPPSDRFSPLPSYLACHSIELSLKAFLFTVGIFGRERRKINHDLELALSRAEGAGFGRLVEVTDEDRLQLREANKPYKEKGFEYFDRLSTIYDPPNFDINKLLLFAKKLHDGIELPVRESLYETPNAPVKAEDTRRRS